MAARIELSVGTQAAILGPTADLSLRSVTNIIHFKNK